MFLTLRELRVQTASGISKLPNSIFFLKDAIAEKNSFKIRSNSGSNTSVIADYMCDLGQIIGFL